MVVLRRLARAGGAGHSPDPGCLEGLSEGKALGASSSQRRQQPLPVLTPLARDNGEWAAPLTVSP